MQSMYYNGLDVHKKNDQLLREGQPRKFKTMNNRNGFCLRQGQLFNWFAKFFSVDYLAEIAGAT